MAHFHSPPNQLHPNQLHQSQLAQAKTKAMLRLLYIALCGVVGYLFTSGPNSEILPVQRLLISYICAGAPAAWPMLFSSSSQRKTTYIVLDGRVLALFWIGRLMASLWVGGFVLPYVVYKCIRTLSISDN